MLTLHLLNSSEEYKWLQKSEFYLSLIPNEDEEEEILNVPYCSINESSPIKYLEVINFWGVNNFTNEFFNSFFKFTDSDKLLIKIKELIELTYSQKYQFLLEFLKKHDDDDPYGYKCCAKFGEIDCLKFLIINNDLRYITDYVYYLACKYGQLDFLIFLFTIKKMYNMLDSLLIGAIEGGHLHIIKYLFESRIYVYPLLENESILCYNRFIVKAIELDDLNILKYFESNPPNNELEYNLNCVMRSLENNSLECLKYLKEVKKISWDTNYYLQKLDINKMNKTLKYAIENGFECDNRLYKTIISENRLDLFKLYHENLNTSNINSFLLDKNLCENIVKDYLFDRIEMLKYSIENGALLNERVGDVAYINKNFKCLKYILSIGYKWDSNKHRDKLLDDLKVLDELMS